MIKELNEKASGFIFFNISKIHEACVVKQITLWQHNFTVTSNTVFINETSVIARQGKVCLFVF
jgi:hypothetical protein